MQTSEADDRFLLVEPGLTWLPGEAPPIGATVVIEPSLETDTARFFVEGKYDRSLGKDFYWSGGTSWDRNEDAGILNRYIVFGGIGHRWLDREDLQFSTVWALSYTDREEEEIDPEKEQQFAGMRVFSNYLDKWGKVVAYENDFRANVSLEDFADYSFDMTNAISVSLSSHLALKVSLQGLFESEPALEDVDVIVRAQLVDPDGIPGSGDEFFESLESGSSEIVVNSGDIRKEEVDVIFRTSLVIKF